MEVAPIQQVNIHFSMESVMIIMNLVQVFSFIRELYKQ
jgi:hypothetical protein